MGSISQLFDKPEAKSQSKAQSPKKEKRNLASGQDTKILKGEKFNLRTDRQTDGQKDTGPSYNKLCREVRKQVIEEIMKKHRQNTC